MRCLTRLGTVGPCAMALEIVAWMDEMLWSGKRASHTICLEEITLA